MARSTEPARCDATSPSARRRPVDRGVADPDPGVGGDGLVETVIGDGFHAIAATGVPILETPLENPIDFGFLGDGRIVFVSYHDPRVLAVSPEGTLTILAGDGGPARAGGLHWPTALELTPTGELLIADTFNHAIRRLELDGTLTTIAGVGVEGYGGDGALATAAALREPYGIALGDEGAIYVADRGNFRIRRIDGDGIIDTIAGTGVEGPAGDDGPALSAAFGTTARLAIDGDGLLVADQGGSKIRRINLR